MDNKYMKCLEELKKIKKDMNIDWFELTEENSKDGSKCAYAIFIDTKYYKKYIGEVGSLIESEGLAIKINKKEFEDLLKGKNLAKKIYKLIEEKTVNNKVVKENEEIEDEDENSILNKIVITGSNINIDKAQIKIKYGDETEQGSYYGDIIIKETTINYIKNYNYSVEVIE